jgi:hypothetical protein
MNEINNKEWKFEPGFRINTLEEAEVYDSLSREDKMLAEIQKQTKFTRNIQNNVKFFFWLTAISIAYYSFKYIEFSLNHI